MIPGSLGGSPPGPSSEEFERMMNGIIFESNKQFITQFVTTAREHVAKRDDVAEEHRETLVLCTIGRLVTEFYDRFVNTEEPTTFDDLRDFGEGRRWRGCTSSPSPSRTGA